MITKLIAHRGDLQPTRLVFLGQLGTQNPSPIRYYTTPNKFYKLAYYIYISLNIGKLKTEHSN